MPKTAEIFVDTNVFLRFLTNDDAAKAARAGRMFREAIDGGLARRTSLLVIAEIIWTLESYYGLSKSQIAKMVEKILNTPNLECEETARILQALDLYVRQNIDFIDAYHAHYLKDIGLAQIATFDRKHFGRVPWVEIVEF